MLREILLVFGMAMLPVIELRGALPVGLAMGVPFPTALAAAVLGNLVPVPFIILFMRRLFLFLSKHFAFMKRLLDAVERRVLKKKDVIDRYALWGLFVLVAIPLPGTGAWTGAMLAALLDIRIKRAIFPIVCGVLTAGLLVLAASLGVMGMFFN